MSKKIAYNRIKIVITALIISPYGISTNINALLHSSATPRQAVMAKLVASKQASNPISFTLQGHPAPVTRCMCTKDGSVISSASQGNIHNLIIWDGKTGAQKHALSIPGGNIDEFFIGPKNDTIIVSIDDPNVQFFTYMLVNLENGTYKQLNFLDQKTVMNIDFCADGKEFVCKIMEDDGTNNLIIADNTGYARLESRNDPKFPSHFTSALNPQKNSIGILSISEKKFNIYDTETLSVQTKITLPSLNENDSIELSYSEDGTALILGALPLNSGPHHFFYNAQTGELLGESRNYTNTIDLAIPTDFSGKKIATYNPHNKNITIRDVLTQVDNVIIAHYDGQNPSLALSPNGQLLAISSKPYNTIQIWDTITKKQISQFDRALLPNDIDFIFSPDNRRIESHAHKDGNCYIQIWDINTKNLMHTFQGDGNVYDRNDDLLIVIEQDSSNNQNCILSKLSALQIKSLLPEFPKNSPIPTVITPPKPEFSPSIKQFKPVASSEPKKVQTWWEFFTSGWW